MRIDRKMRIIMRDDKAVALSINQFRMFDVIHQAGYKGLTIGAVRDALYGGSDAPLTLGRGVHVTTYKLNRKLAHIGFRIRVVNLGRKTFYQLEDRRVGFFTTGQALQAAADND